MSPAEFKNLARIVLLPVKLSLYVKGVENAQSH